MKAKRGFLDGYRTYTGPLGSPKEWRAAFAATMGLDEARQRVGQQSPWVMLGVALTASWAEITTAFRAAVRAVHPDRCGVHGLSEADATERTKAIIAAYTVLRERFGR